MEYGVYKNVRNASWQCLIDCGITELPINPVQVAAHYDIICKQATADWLKGASGQIIAVKDKIYILVNDSEPHERQRFTVMHELGHYLLGHLGDVPMSRSEDECRPEEEQAADKFAVDMLAPACVLCGLGLHSAEDIACMCEISMQAARFRAQRMELLYRRNMFLSHPLERKVFEQFGDFIRNSLNPHKNIF